MTLNYEPEEEPPKEDYTPTSDLPLPSAPSRGTW